jgi:hypothetical protein
MKASGWFVLAVALAACGGDDDNVITGDSDAPPIGADVTFTLYRADAPVVFAYRDAGTDAWQDIAPLPDDMYTLHVHGPFEVIAVCGVPGAYETHVLQAAPSDFDLFMFCFGGSTTTTDPPQKTLTGSMAQTGEVTIDGHFDASDSDTVPWTFSIDVDEDTARADLLAYDDNRILIRRDVDLASPIDDVDLAAGVDFTEHAVTLGGRESDDAIQTFLAFSTMAGSMYRMFSGQLVRQVPLTALEQSDFQYSYITAQAGRWYRFHVVEAEDHVELLPRLMTVTFQGLTATWQGDLPTAEAATLDAYSAETSVGIEARPGWYQGRTTLGMPTGLPELPDGALPKATDVYYESLSISADNGASSSSYSLAPTGVRQTVARPDVRRLRALAARNAQRRD